MAKLTDGMTELEITPRRYTDMEDDPFIYSYFELSKGGKCCARNFSAVLLKSE